MSPGSTLKAFETFILPMTQPHQFSVPSKDNLVTHFGSCHCGAVKFKVEAPADIVAIDCNCSICKKKTNLHFIVPETRFTLLQGEEALTTYTFNTKQAKHTFCKHCGVQAFYRPRSNPDGYGVNPKCIDSDTVKSLSIVNFDGNNWEKTMEKSNIKELSK